MRQTIPQAFIRYRQIAGLVLVACAAIGAAGRVWARSRGVKTQSVIRVAVYNYAHVAHAELEKAERQAASLFASTGDRIVWLDYPDKKRLVHSSSAPSTADLFVRILFASKLKRVRRISAVEIMGESILTSGNEWPVHGRIANLFFDRVKHVSTLWGLSSGEVLGDAIAHELGHLLLGIGHSGRGIMKADWTSRDLVLAARGELKFRPSQVAALQSAALSLRQDSSPMVLAQR
jgi:hypothetical protein